MKLLKKLAIVMVAAIVAAPLTVAAEQLPDLKKTGSITVQMNDGNTPVAGEELTLARVAVAISKNDGEQDAIDRGYALKCTDQFSDEQELVNKLTADNAGDTAKAVYAYASKKNISGTSAVADESGTVQFSSLSAGLYLIWNSKAPAGYQTIDPFLVTIPVKNKNGFIYDVDATPKMEKYEVLSEFAAVVVSDPPVQKVIEGDNPPLVDRFLFMMKRLDSSSPLPVNDNGHVLSIDGDTLTLYANGAEKVEIGTFTFTQEGDYYYEVSEVNNGLEGYSYDDHVYWYKYEVRRDETGKKLMVNRFLVKNGGAEGETTYDDNKVSDTVVFTFTNTYHKKNEPVPAKTGSDQPKKLLPHTGQLWWPVMVLAAAGVICIVGGLLTGARKRTNANK